VQRGEEAGGGGIDNASLVRTQRALRGLRLLIPPSLDAGVWAISLVLATFLRLQTLTAAVLTWRLLEVVVVAMAVQVIVGFAAGLYRVRWRLGSFEEITSLALTVSVATVVVVVIDVVAFRHGAPIGAVLIAGADTFIAAAGGRSLWRLAGERRVRPSERARRAIIFGAGTGGQQLVDALARSSDSHLLPVALLDDHPARQKSRIRHLRVTGGRADIAAVAERSGATALVVAIPSASSELILDLSQRAGAAGLEVYVLPPVPDLLKPATVGVDDVRRVSTVDLLGRHPIDTDVQSIAGYVLGRRVLVTGAGGSIGSELCRQLHRFAPASLIMLDRDESGLHQVQLSIEGRALLDSRRLVVCDIRDRQAVAEVFDEHRPEVVFHAAALKHLPLLEMWPAEAVKTNVVGTQNLLDAATATGVTTFVNISTDKAANPSSVLGYTKRLAERLTAAAVSSAGGTCAYISVRFGNVLGSRGSVLTAFRAQIDAGGPITVTHPDVTRYFMTVEEAVQLVIQGGAIGSSGEVLVLDMGKPVEIAAVARLLAAEATRPVRIVYTGLRPGEKLHEELFGSGEVSAGSRHPLIRRVVVPPVDFDAVQRVLDGPRETPMPDRLRLACAQPGAPQPDSPQPVAAVGGESQERAGDR